MHTILPTTLDTLIHHNNDYKTGIDQGGFINPMDVLTNPLGWALLSFHACRILELYLSLYLYFLFISYFTYLSRTYILSLFFY